jgi:hypothetical protein
MDHSFKQSGAFLLRSGEVQVRLVDDESGVSDWGTSRGELADSSHCRTCFHNDASTASGHVQAFVRTPKLNYDS